MTPATSEVVIEEAPSPATSSSAAGGRSSAAGRRGVHRTRSKSRDTFDQVQFTVAGSGRRTSRRGSINQPGLGDGVRFVRDTSNAVLDRVGPPGRSGTVLLSTVKHAHGWWIIDPRTSKFLPMWDATIGSCLVFTAFFTPFEVSFMPAPTDGEPRLPEPALLVVRDSPFNGTFLAASLPPT